MEYSYERIKTKIILVEANRFRSQPEKILNSYCDQIGIKFEPAMLQWDDPTMTTGHSHPPEYYQKWRKTLNSSKTILTPKNVNVKIRPEDKKMIETVMIIYRKLASFSL